MYSRMTSFQTCNTRKLYVAAVGHALQVEVCLRGFLESPWTLEPLKFTVTRKTAKKSNSAAVWNSTDGATATQDQPQVWGTQTDPFSSEKSVRQAELHPANVTGISVMNCPRQLQQRRNQPAACCHLQRHITYRLSPQEINATNTISIFQQTTTQKFISAQQSLFSRSYKYEWKPIKWAWLYCCTVRLQWKVQQPLLTRAHKLLCCSSRRTRFHVFVHRLINQA